MRAVVAMAPRKMLGGTEGASVNRTG